MKRSIEDQIKLTALKQTAPPSPTLLEKPKSVQEDLMGGGSSNTLCGVTFPLRYLSVLQDVYTDMIDWMYCRPNPIPGGGCDQLSLGPPVGDGSIPASQWVTDRDKPLSWQRAHPDFNPDDPATWGSLFGPGGFVDEGLRWWLAYADENGQYGRGPLRPGVTQADIDAMIDIIRQLYIARCSFAVAQTGSCCVFDDFGGAQCTTTTSYSCPGIYTAGGNCNGPNPCGLAPNQIQQNDQTKKQTPIMDMVMSALKGNKMSDSIENKLRNISKSVKGPIPTLFNTDNIADVGKIVKQPGDEVPGSPCGVQLTNSWQSYIYDAIIYGIYGKSAGMPVIGGNDGKGQVTTRDPVSPLWERANPEFNPADPNSWGKVFGPGGEAERLVKYFNHGLSDAEINRMVEELRQLYLLRCGFLVSQGGSCCTFDDFGGAQCSEVGSAGNCKGVFTPGGNCSGSNPCGNLMPNLIQKNDEMKKQKQVMDMVMSIMKVRKKSTGGCVTQTVNGPLCIASDISREACQAMSDNRYGGQINVWWFNGVPCDMESASRVDYNNGGILMERGI